ncbi:MAG: dipeptide epimerase [Alphaproteobacteria bacterium]|nr:dipeptide epimerase [Alphaproteobacteria bacterium]
MSIVSAELLPCVQRLTDTRWAFVRGPLSELHGWTLRLADEAGHIGFGYGHAMPTVSIHGAGAKAGLDYLLPRLIGRDPFSIAEIMQDIDNALAGQPSVKAAIDMALHDLAARRLGVSLDALLGGRRRAAIPQGRIVPLKPPAEMAEVARALAAEGYPMIKLKWSGDPDLDVARTAAIRQAVGPATTLMLDTNQSYSAKTFIRTFARVERFDIALVEQPVPAADRDGLALITRTIPASVEADESAGSVDDVFRLVSDRVVDSINLKITKLGGIRKTLAAATICHAGGVSCRLGAAFGPSLLQAFSTHVAAVFHTLESPCELSEHLHLTDDPFTPLLMKDGLIAVPTAIGCGVALR